MTTEKGMSLWERVIQENVPDATERKDLQKFFGAVQTKNNPLRALFLIGGGRTGKSLVMSVLQSLRPKEEVFVLRYEDAQNRGTGPSPALCAMKDKYLVCMADLPPDGRKYGFIKQFVSRDEITARDACSKEFMTYRPNFAFAMEALFIPPAIERDAGLMARILPIRFHRENPRHTDMELLGKIQRDLESVRWWAAEGITHFLASGFCSGRKPQASQKS